LAFLVNFKLHGSNRLYKFVQRWRFIQNEAKAIRKAVVWKKFDDFQQLKQRVASNDLDEDK